MPNHVHGIIRINYNGKCQEKGDQPVAPTTDFFFEKPKSHLVKEC